MDKDRIEGSAKQIKGSIKEAAGKVTGMVCDHEDLDQFDPEVAQLLRKPGTVLVADGRGQDLGAGDQDAGPYLAVRTAARPEYFVAKCHGLTLQPRAGVQFTGMFPAR